MVTSWSSNRLAEIFATAAIDGPITKQGQSRCLPPLTRTCVVEGGRDQLIPRRYPMVQGTTRVRPCPRFVMGSIFNGLVFGRRNRKPSLRQNPESIEQQEPWTGANGVRTKSWCSVAGGRGGRRSRGAACLRSPAPAPGRGAGRGARRVSSNRPIDPPPASPALTASAAPPAAGPPRRGLDRRAGCWGRAGPPTPPAPAPPPVATARAAAGRCWRMARSALRAPGSPDRTSPAARPGCRRAELC
jgi:hypothetical protein